MAQRRMFNKSVTNNDNFLEMPDSSQNLYFHLSMNADDDGFVDNWKSIMRMTGHKDDDLKVLITKNFVIPFESGVIVIRHWRLNNYLRNDRYTHTQYTKELSLLSQNEQNVYCLDTLGIPSGNPDKISIDKISIDNNIQNQQLPKKLDLVELEKEFEYLWKMYPNKQGKNDAKQKYLKYRKSGVQYQNILNGLNKYLNYIQQEKIPIQYIKHGSTWFNQKCWEDEYKTSNVVVQGERNKQNELLKGVYDGTIKID